MRFWNLILLFCLLFTLTARAQNPAAGTGMGAQAAWCSGGSVTRVGEVAFENGGKVYVEACKCKLADGSTEIRWSLTNLSDQKLKVHYTKTYTLTNGKYLKHPGHCVLAPHEVLRGETGQHSLTDRFHPQGEGQVMLFQLLGLKGERVE